MHLIPYPTGVSPAHPSGDIAGLSGASKFDRFVASAPKSIVTSDDVYFLSQYRGGPDPRNGGVAITVAWSNGGS